LPEPVGDTSPRRVAGSGANMGRPLDTSLHPPKEQLGFPSREHAGPGIGVPSSNCRTPTDGTSAGSNYGFDQQTPSDTPGWHTPSNAKKAF
jgi:hypothetical protein